MLRKSQKFNQFSKVAQQAQVGRIGAIHSSIHRTLGLCKEWWEGAERGMKIEEFCTVNIHQ
jgi:hypothetical protein